MADTTNGADVKPQTLPRLTPPHILQQLQAIRQQLIESGVLEPSSYSAGQLGSLLFRVEDLQSSHPDKIPWNVLNDFTIGGHTQAILTAILEYAKKAKWLSLDLNEKTFPALLQHLLDIAEPLRFSPRIYISPTISGDLVDRIQDIIHHLNGKIVDVAQATHIVDTGHPATKSLSKTRIIVRSGSHALLHRVKYPRSHRRWVPLKQIPSDAVSDSEPASGGPNSTPIRVSADWITLSDQFHEWLDENDFILSDQDPSVIKLTRKNGSFVIQGVSGPIAKASPEAVASQPTKKRRSSMTTEKPAQVVKKIRMPSPLVSPTEASEKHNFALDDETSMNVVPLISQRKKFESIEDSFPYKDAIMAPVATMDSEHAPSYPVVIPCYSTWFSFDSVHANERKSLHELFSIGENAEALYMQQRNFIVNAYRANPRVHLSATACRKMIAGDAVSLIRIHNFLEQWGIINYHVDPGSLPQYCGPGNPTLNSSQVYVHSPWAGVQKLQEFNCTPCSSSDWSESEIQSLLEAVLKHGENWDAVAEAVGNDRSSADCLQQFISIPLENYTTTNRDGGLVKGEFDQVQSDLLLPFKDSAHPILSQVALLSSISHADSVVSALNANQSADSNNANAMAIDAPNEADLHVGLPVRVDPYGTGIIAQPIRSNGIVCVKLAYGLIYCPVDNVVPVHDDIRVPESPNGVSLQNLAQSCMISAALKSKDISAAESRSILALVGELVETQMKKIEIKLKQFDEVQVVLSRQRELIEQARQEVFAERIELAHARMKLAHSQAATSMESTVSPNNA